MPGTLPQGRMLEVELTGQKGVNLYRDPRKLGAEDMAEGSPVVRSLVLSQNAFPVRPGLFPSKRRALTWQSYFDMRANILNFTSNSFPVAAVAPAFPSAFDVVSVICDVGDDSFHVVVIDRAGTGLVSISIPAAGMEGNRPWLTSFGQAVYVMFGWGVQGSLWKVDAIGASPFTPGGLNKQANGVQIQQLQWTTKNVSGVTGTAKQTPFPRVACQYKSRFVYGNLGPGFENYIIFSDNFLPLQVAITNNDDPILTRGFQIGRSGDPIVAISEIMLTAQGDPTQSALLVLTQYESYIITGQPNQCVDNQASVSLTNDMDVAHTNYRTGCVSPWTLVRSPYGLFWAGPDDVWFLATGPGSPLRVGTKIRPALLRTPPSAWGWLTAAYFDGVYRLTCFGDGQGQGFEGQFPQDGILIPPLDQWWLDLRDGPPQGDPAGVESQESARWFGPMQFAAELGNGTSGVTGTQYGTRTMWVDDRAGQAPALWGLERGLLSWSTGGPPGGLSLVSYDQPSERDLPFDPNDINLVQGYEVPGQPNTEIQMDIRVPPLTLGDARLQKLYQALTLNAWTSEPVQLAVDAILEGGQTVDTQSLNIDIQGAQMGITPLDTGAPWSTTTQGLRIPGNPSGRDLGKDIQLRIYDNTGYTVDASNNTLVFWRSLPGTTVSVVQIAQGVYEVGTLFNAIVAAMNSVYPANFSHNQSASPRLAPVITSAAGNFKFGFVPDATFVLGSTLTQAQLTSCQKLLDMVGFPVGVNPAAAATFTANVVPFNRGSAIVELVDVFAEIMIIPRRPV